MALTINTNISSLIAQRSFDAATNALNTSIERMTTGYTINRASDNAAGHSIAKMWETQLGSLDIAAANAATGSDMLTTVEETYSLITSHFQRIRDLTEQAANGTYGSSSLKAIKSEMVARLDEISRISSNAEFNGIRLMDGSAGTVKLQVGLYGDQYSTITLNSTLFAKATATALFTDTTLANMTGVTTSDQIATKLSGYVQGACKNDQATYLTGIDKIITNLSDRVTGIGAAQNRTDSALSALDVQIQNITSSLSTLRDTDIASESSTYIQAQILQQASATLLSTANQLPSIALNLI